MGATSKQPRLAIGPANYAGQATSWARAVRDHLPAKAWSFAEAPRGGFRFPCDRPIPRWQFRNPLLRGLRSRILFAATTHVAIDGFEPYFHLRRRGQLAGDLEWLRRHGLTTALIAHGSDVRDPVRHMEINGEWSMFHAGSAEWREDLVRATRVHRAIAEDSGLPVFCSTPDLLLDLPFGTWLPVCLDIEAWRSHEPVLERDVPRVLHVPSKRNPPIKGTQFVEPVLERLAKAGRIEHVAPTGVTNAEMRALVFSADIVVDQILAGSYGVATVESLAAGRVTFGRMASEVSALMAEPPPLFQADPENLEEEICRVLEDRDVARAKAATGPEFVKRWHDGRASAEALRPYLGV